MYTVIMVCCFQPSLDTGCNEAGTNERGGHNNQSYEPGDVHVLKPPLYDAGAYRACSAWLKNIQVTFRYIYGTGILIGLEARIVL